MLKLVFVGTIAAVATATSPLPFRMSEMTDHPVNEDTVMQVKRMSTTWVPHEVHENPLAKLSLGELHQLLGTTLHAPMGYSPPKVTPVPDSFDPRIKWPSCIHAIMD